MPSSTAPVHARITGPIVMIGFGSIGKGTLPLIERHFEYDKSRFVIIDPHEDGELAKKHGVSSSSRPSRVTTIARCWCRC